MTPLQYQRELQSILRRWESDKAPLIASLVQCECECMVTKITMIHSGSDIQIKREYDDVTARLIQLTNEAIERIDRQYVQQIDAFVRRHGPDGE